jgi:hypothetical protein
MPVYGRHITAHETNYDHDLVIKGTDTLAFDNETVIVNGSVIVEEAATLFLRNSNLTILQINGTAPRNFTMRNPVNGMPKLTVENSEIDSSGDPIVIYMNEASASLNGLTTRSNLILTKSYVNVSSSSTGISGAQGIWASDNSIIRLTNTTGGTDLPLTLDDSTVIASNGGMASVSLSNNSNMTLTNSSEISKKIYVLDNTTLRATNSVVAEFRAANAMLYMTNSTIVTGEAVGKTSMIIDGCVPPYQINSLQLYDNSTAQISKSRITNLAVYNNSRVAVSDIQSVGAISSLIMRQNAVAAFSRGQIDNVFAYDDSKSTFSEIQFLQVTIAENVNVTMSNVIVQQWMCALDNSTTKIEKSTLRGSFDQEEVSRLSISDTSINIFSVRNLAFASLSNTTVTEIRALDRSIVNIMRSRISGLEIHSSSVTGTINGIARTQLQYWNLQKNNTLAFTSADGYLPNVTLTEMAGPEHVSLFFGGTSNITVSDAELETLVLQDNTLAKAYNSSIGSIGVKGNSTIYSYWYITIQVTDKQKAPISGANVAIYEPKTGLLAQGTTDANGKFVYNEQVLASVISGTKITDSLVFEAAKGNDFVRMLATDFPSGNVQLPFSSSIPWYQQYWYLLALIIALAVAIVAVMLRFKR